MGYNDGVAKVVGKMKRVIASLFLGIMYCVISIIALPFIVIGIIASWIEGDAA
jgi:hypothetical protein